MQTTTIALPLKRTESQNSEGFTNEEWSFLKGIRANVKDTTRQDELLANQCGYEASIVVEIAACAFNNASFFVDEATGIVYDVERTYKPEKSLKIQLTGSRRENGKL